jgi:hypothetical protein
MQIGKKYLILYDAWYEKPTRIVGIITNITGDLIEIDNKTIINAKSIVRAELQEGGF